MFKKLSDGEEHLPAPLTLPIQILGGGFSLTSSLINSSGKGKNKAFTTFSA